MPPCTLQALFLAILLAAPVFGEEASAPAPRPVPPGIGSFLAPAGPEGPDPLDRERFVLRRLHGDDAPLALSAGAGAAFLIPVKAGRPIPGFPPRERPSYGDLFQEGTVLWAEARFRMRPALELAVRSGFEYFRGRSVDEGVLGRVRYGSMWIVPALGGLRLGLPLGLPSSTWWVTDFTPREKGAFPYLEFLAGVAHRTAVDHDPLGPYWRAATVFAADAAAGIEYRFGGLAVFASVSFAYRSEPPERIWYADPEALMALLVRGGMVWRF